MKYVCEEAMDNNKKVEVKRNICSDSQFHMIYIARTFQVFEAQIIAIFNLRVSFSGTDWVTLTQVLALWYFEKLSFDSQIHSWITTTTSQDYRRHSKMDFDKKIADGIRKFIWFILHSFSSRWWFMCHYSHFKAGALLLFLFWQTSFFHLNYLCSRIQFHVSSTDDCTTTITNEKDIRIVSFPD